MADVLLVDLSSIAHPLYHVSGNEPDPDFVSQKTVATVRGLAGDHKHVAVCCDKGRSFRKTVNADYKANRPDAIAPLMHQIDLAKDVLAKDGFPIWQADTFEADDVIATGVMAAVDHGLSVMVASSDKDLLQLVDDNAGVTAKSIMNGTVFDEAGVKLKFGVLPRQMRDYLALVGDASDNIKGLAGVGAKRAAEILTAHESVDALYGKLGTMTDPKLLGLTPAVLKAFHEGQETIRTAQALILLRTDAPIDFDEILKDRIPQSVTEDTMNELMTETAEVMPDAPVDPTFTPVKTEQGLTVIKPTEIAPGTWNRGLEPRNAEDARTIAKWLFNSRLFSNYGSPEAVFAILLAGRELGLGTMAALRGFHNIKGKVCMAADLMRALVLSSGHAEYFMCTNRTADTATWSTKRKSDPQPTSLTYTLEEAKMAGLISAGSGWAKFPGDMVAKTASAKLCRLVYADVTFGFFAPSELGGDEE